MPPPMAPIPPMAPPQASAMADPHFPPPPTRQAPQPPPVEPASPMAMPPAAGTPSYTPPLPSSASVSSGPSSAQMGAMNAATPAPVVPLQQAQPKRALVGQGAKKISGRPLSAIAKRGVQLEPLDPKVVKMLDLQSNILERLRAKLDLDKVPMDRLHEEELWQKAERATIDLVETLETSGELPKYIDQDALIKETLNEALALGPLEDLFADEAIDEILIDRRDRLVVGKNGVMRGSGKAFSTDDVFERVVKRLVHEAGATIDDARPVVDLRMRDGTRLTAAVSPVAARGAVLALKKPPAAMPQLTELVAQGTLSSGMADLLTTCIAARRNILVCGGNGSGKTSVVAALAAASPPGERVVSIEDVAELAIGRDEWIQLEARPATDAHAVDVAALLEMALRLQPDRLVVGEVRGREALSVVHALNAQVDGAIVAATGEGASAVLNRIATLARSVGGDHAAIRELVATAFEIVIHVVRHADGSVKVHSIEEITGVTDTAYETQTVFALNGSTFAPTGAVPRFYAELEARGIPANQAVFRSSGS
jgi:pilus assembly protein CpaF